MTVGRTVVVSIVVSLLLTAAARSAHAQETAKEWYEKATAAYALGRYSDAAAGYEKAFELKPGPELLYNAAQAHRLAGNKPRALQLYQSYLNIYHSRKETKRSEVLAQIDALTKAIEAERASAPSPPVPTTAPVETAKPPALTQTPPPPTTAVTTTTEIVARPPARKPLTKQGWFWGAVVGGTVVVAAAVVLGLTLGITKAPSAGFGVARGN